MENDQLSQEELEAEGAEALPDREAMSTIAPPDPLGVITLPVEPLATE